MTCFYLVLKSKSSKAFMITVPTPNKKQSSPNSSGLDWRNRNKSIEEERRRIGDSRRDIYGEFVHDGGATGGSKPGHGVVHVPRGLDDIHFFPLLFMASRSLCPWLLSWHGMDHCQSRSLRGKPITSFTGRKELRLLKTKDSTTG